jgi:hypothetical protein
VDDQELGFCFAMGWAAREDGLSAVAYCNVVAFCLDVQLVELANSSTRYTNELKLRLGSARFSY